MHRLRAQFGRRQIDERALQGTGGTLKDTALSVGAGGEGAERGGRREFGGGGAGKEGLV